MVGNRGVVNVVHCYPHNGITLRGTRFTLHVGVVQRGCRSGFVDVAASAWNVHSIMPQRSQVQGWSCVGRELTDSRHDPVSVRQVVILP
jgi:hypothetical protein